MEHIYLGRQPILDKDGKLNSYEVLYSEDKKADSYALNDFRSAMIINTILNKFGTHEILGGERAFIKIGEKFLLSDIIFTIPNQFFIFSLLEDVSINERVIERLEQLINKGFILALDELIVDASTLDKYKNILSEISYIKININASFVQEEGTKEILSALSDRNITIIGTKIEDNEKYILAQSIGCELFQGYFFSKPEIFQCLRYDSTQSDILKLYKLLMEDTNIDEITAELEKNHPLSIQLLKYINSGIFNINSKISTIHHVLTLIGRTSLAQWLMFMIYAKAVSKGSQIAPLMLQVDNRTKLMDAILREVKPDVRSNMLGEAYFVGLLSFLDTIFGKKLEDILQSMNVDDAISDALLHESGLLGEIFTLVKDIEHFNMEKITTFERKYNLKEAVFQDLILQNMK